jgi:hypothetical protein
MEGTRRRRLLRAYAVLVLGKSMVTPPANDVGADAEWPLPADGVVTWPHNANDLQGKRETRRAGVRYKQNRDIDGVPADHELDGTELNFEFDEKMAKTVLVVPASEDLALLWELGLEGDDVDPDADDLKELGGYILQRCR